MCTPTIFPPRPTSRTALGGKLGIGEAITVVQDTFGKVFNAGTSSARDGSQFDRLFHDGDSYTIGGLRGTRCIRPGHTPACMTHVISDAYRPRLSVTHFSCRTAARRGRFSRRRCAHAVPLDPPDPGAATDDAAVHVPRLRTRTGAR